MQVCDMGFARFVLSKTNTLAGELNRSLDVRSCEVGTPDYMAPVRLPREPFAMPRRRLLIFPIRTTAALIGGRWVW